MRKRMVGRADNPSFDPSLDRSVEQPGYLDDESEMQKAIEESKKSAQEYETRLKERYIYFLKIILHINEYLFRYLIIVRKMKQKRQ